jgi:hypothetical protein
MNEYGEGKTTMPHKSYGRIFVEKKEDVEKVKQVIKEMDTFEFDYLPDDLITVFNGKKDVVYTHKFDDLDLNDLMIKCWEAGIHTFYMI